MNAAGDGNGPAQGNIQVGKFILGQFGSRVNGRTGFVDNNIMDRQLMGLNELGHKLFGFIGGSTVANRNQGYPILPDGAQHIVGSPLLFGLAHGNIQGMGSQYRAGCIDNGHFAACPVAWV
ncbi:hypothetical protein SDC9_209783 [bioreactor metagenome]|uniref:Uncharacterized protein n=1 Tax=bioreactor metagenome TaxID=1076179 RepID=A0A645JF94_9ZZZZ